MEEEKSCPVCLSDYSRDHNILKDSNANHEIVSSCKHWFCCECLRELYNRGEYRCPLCRVIITELLESYDDDE
jgi:hypothetical protein